MEKYYRITTLNRIVLSAAFISSVFAINSCTKEVANDPSPQAQSVSSAFISSDAKSGDIIPGQYIVVLQESEANKRINPNASYEELTRQARSYGQNILREKGIGTSAIAHAYGKTIAGFSARLDEAEVAKLRADVRVAYVEPDRVITLAQGKKPGGGGGGSAVEEIPYGITRVGGGTTYTGDKTAWIIDTGIDLDHPDLKVDVNRSVTMFTSGKDGSSADDGNGHGSHVAGTVAALANSIGVVGVAAGATVVAVKVLDSRGSGAYSGVIKGVDYVAANGQAGDVANMSLGGPVSDALDAAVIKAAATGIFFVLAAGNESKDATTTSPARAEGTNIFTVSAMDASDQFASFSNFGPPVDFCAPGVGIKSTWKGGAYNTISGTSMASPHVAGVLLLTNGKPAINGSVSGDPDGNPDPIAHK